MIQENGHGITGATDAISSRVDELSELRGYCTANNRVSILDGSVTKYYH